MEDLGCLVFILLVKIQRKVRIKVPETWNIKDDLMFQGWVGVSISFGRMWGMTELTL